MMPLLSGIPLLSIFTHIFPSKDSSLFSFSKICGQERNVRKK
ncbi:hypothetical protein HMPREF0083_04945 [Aneurinibacillus aneurinilyticus ATCC 12856]|uniref:Uncharacterized protein n=1 Tax=Aneurinibacillus aneurinilyticus ATCC 12856 TaxID=649747 RepID=U1WEI9_ANEAE|nr:hypothetical protein HMPREF0083_04945 [Aneurinibacillus aneurinilyticus ATCC 12856]